MKRVLMLFVAAVSLGLAPPDLKPAAPRSGPGEGLPNLPQAVTSFGGAVSGDALYIYGGHIGREHAHSAENLSDGFYRLNLASRRGAAWETLPMGTRLQGLPMVAHGGKLYRVGGLSMLNKAGEAENLQSVDEFARFDPATNAWESLPPLPVARSSHDAAVLDGRLYVLGGWKLTGDDSDAQWAEHGYVADLRGGSIAWEPLPAQPFKHRALALAATTKRLYAVGGLTETGQPTAAVHIYDPATRVWSQGPPLPANTPVKAFAASAFGVGDTIWASAVDGRIYSLTEGDAAWSDTHYDLRSPRFFHRLLPHGDRLLFVGGANRGGHTDSVESVEFATLRATPLTKLEAATPSPLQTQQGSTTWPGFRGTGDSHTQAKDLPLTWSATENIAWSIDLPGYGQSSPVVHGGRVFVTSLEGATQETLHVSCFDLTSGKPLWTRSFDATQTVSNTDYVSKAAPTPAVDDKGLYVFFESGELLALDPAKGETLWQRSLTKDYGLFKGNHGLGASIAQTADSVILLIDHDGPSYLLSVDKATGKDRWKIHREKRVSWSSPVVANHGGREEVLISSVGVVEAYDARDGTRLWGVEGLKGNTSNSPSLGGDAIVIGSGEKGSCLALERDGRVRWKSDQATSSFGSPLVVGESAYFVNRAGVVFNADLKTGATRWTFRLPGSSWASPVAAGGLVYFFCKDGQAVVIQSGEGAPVKVAESSLTIQGPVYGVAAVDGAFLLRTGRKLVRIGKP